MTERARSELERPSESPSRWLYATSANHHGFGVVNVPDFGKWCVRRAPDAIDRAWRVVRSLVDEGHIIHAKVSGIPGATAFGTHLICVYTPRWYDEADVMRVREVLRTAGFTERLGYKRDLDTRAKIYGGPREWWYQA